MPKGTRGGRLVALIQAQLDVGETIRSLARRANNAGHDISHSHIADLLAGTVARAPLPDKIAAYAAALDTSYDEVRRAVLYDWYGYEEIRGGDFDALIGPLEGQDRDELERMVRAWVAAKRDD